jgi:hypothetical protein
MYNYSFSNAVARPNVTGAPNAYNDIAGTSTPLFITQGFIENNTKPEDVEEYLDNHRGVERGWMGQS